MKHGRIKVIERSSVTKEEKREKRQRVLKIRANITRSKEDNKLQKYTKLN